MTRRTTQNYSSEPHNTGQKISIFFTGGRATRAARRRASGRWRRRAPSQASTLPVSLASASATPRSRATSTTRSATRCPTRTRPSSRPSSTRSRSTRWAGVYFCRCINYFLRRTILFLGVFCTHYFLLSAYYFL